MKALATLVFKWEYDRTRYDALCKHSLFHQGIGHSQTLWVIRADAQKAVEAILGTPLLIEGQLLGPTPDVDVPSWKGKNSLEVVEVPAGWMVIEHQKPKEGGKPQTHEYLVPLSLVETLWESVWTKYPLNMPVKFERIAEDTCTALGITRFHRKTGTFDKQKFQGSRRQAYMPAYYNPMKVYEFLGAVRHGSHTSTRLLDHLPLQTTFLLSSKTF